MWKEKEVEGSKETQKKTGDIFRSIWNNAFKIKNSNSNVQQILTNQDVQLLIRTQAPASPKDELNN